MIAGAALLGRGDEPGQGDSVVVGKGGGPDRRFTAGTVRGAAGRLPWLAQASGNAALDIADRFYRTGALVSAAAMSSCRCCRVNWSRRADRQRSFLAGYGAAQAGPGPLFSFAFYAGMMLKTPPNGITGGLLALGAIYLPSFLLVLGALPFGPVGATCRGCGPGSTWPMPPWSACCSRR